MKILSILFLLFINTVFVQAATFTVTRNDDRNNAACVPGDCSLREAVSAANAAPSNDVINFANTLTKITLTNDIAINNAGTLEIIGTGANNLTIDGGAGDNRIFYIESTTATISGATLTGGGGGPFRGKLSDGGGAIYATEVSLTLDHVHVTGNSARSNGGGAYFGGFGGNTVRIIDSTFSNNTTSDNCGGFSSSDGDNLIVINSTISGNTALRGGGFCSSGGTVLRNVTVTANTSSDGGGGIVKYGGRLDFGNTIVAGNISSSLFGPEILLFDGTITSSGGNLVGDSMGDSTNTNLPMFPNAPLISYQPTDIRDVNPRLGVLTNNGGTTPTHAILPGSPLIDKGLNALAVNPFGGNTALVFDQRGAGFARIIDGNNDGTAIVDIGAFERSNASGIRPTLFDFDGDGRADISVFRPSNGFWHIVKSSGGYSSVQWGQKDDALVPGDYDGDGRTDLAVYRVGAGGDFAAVNNTWYIRRSSDSTFFARAWGTSSFFEFDVPVPADFDGDGRTDLTVYRLSDGLGESSGFNILQSSTDSGVYRQWGTNVDKRVPADYDGDGKADIAVYRTEPRFSSNGIGIWQILQSSNGATREVQFGLSTDRALPADYDGDGKADLAVYRPSNGFWYILGSRDGFRAMQFGVATDKPTPADYDGDGKTDIAVFRPSNGTWYLQRSTEGFAAYVFGFGDDIPIPNVYVR